MCASFLFSLNQIFLLFFVFSVTKVNEDKGIDTNENNYSGFLFYKILKGWIRNNK